MSELARTVEAVWRIEGARVLATLTRMTGDLDRAEDLAQESLVDALSQWSEAGVPANPGAWLTTVARRKAIDAWRRAARLESATRRSPVTSRPRARTSGSPSRTTSCGSS